ncbi:MAG: MBL fold metallo-hydrolase [Planctomycetota bacterium]|nr:MBL fold metallo-hydrolase [Planctomycetota bacterium]
MRLQFLGANKQVTGSRYRLDVGDLTLLIDCGMYQERSCLHRNWEPSPVEPRAIDRLLLTHAHLDHCGLIPKLVGKGYRDPILATPPTIDLARVVMEDAAHIQEEDAAYKRRRHKRENRKGPHPAVPLYTAEDAQAAGGLFRTVQYGKPVDLSEDVTVTWHDAGHILGSAMLEIVARDNGNSKRIIFSGDVGEWDSPLMRDPATFDKADYIIMESTYGDRDHAADGDVSERLTRIVNETVQRGGNLIIPTFAIDRAQDLLYYFSRLAADERIPHLGVSLDSPMAIDATTIYKTYKYLMDEETQSFVASGEHPFQFAGLHFARTRDESRRINSMSDPRIIMAGSGMCTGGRIKYHLRQNIERPESTILFVGYQAEHTLGRHIVSGAKEVRIHGRRYPVRARIERIDGLSAHADRSGLMRWLGGFQSAPRRLFLTHGEADVAASLASHVQDRLGWDVRVPEYEEIADLGS